MRKIVVYALVMIINRNAQNLFRIVLTDDIVVEMLLYFCGSGKLDAFLRGILFVMRNYLFANRNALVANANRTVGRFDKVANLGTRTTAKRA